MILNRTIDSYHFGFSLNLNKSQLHTLTGLFHHPVPASLSALAGRTSVTPVQLDEIGSVVIKHYRRGGLMRYFIKRRYLKFGKTRAQREFELLDIVGTLGLNVPQPIAYAHCGRLLYRAWLITREIKQPLSLARLCLIDEKRAQRTMKSVIAQISRLIDHNLLHVDLHPGNVVVDQKDRVFLLDFDKGKVYKGNKTKLKYRYINRWQRAVSKHGLPKMLSEMLRTGLN